MKELIEFIAGRLVEHPEHIEVKLQEEEDSISRTVLAASQAGEGKRARLEIIE